MSHVPDDAERLKFLTRVVGKEARHLAETSARLFTTPFTQERAEQLDSDTDLAERVEAFVSRFARLQDTVGDKLLPAMLRAMGEPLSAMIDNLDRAERLGWLSSADEWLVARRIRNRMVHEYVEDAALLADALQEGHRLVPLLVSTANQMIAELRRRGWL